MDKYQKAPFNVVPFSESLIKSLDLIQTELELVRVDGSTQIVAVWMEREVYAQRTPPGTVVVWEVDTGDCVMLHFPGARVAGVEETL